jgi:hypothetical protein
MYRILILSLLTLLSIPAQPEHRHLTQEQTQYLLGIKRYGCSLTQAKNPDKKDDPYWYLDVWVSGEDDVHHGKLLSVQLKRTDSLKDCNSWMEAMQRNLKELNNKKVKTP